MQQSRDSAVEDCAAMEDTGRTAPTYPDGAVTRERDDAARDCRRDGRVAEHGKPRPHGL